VTAIERFRSRLDECPLVAIVRGVTPDEAEAVGDAIYAAGIRIIEIPLNSPEPFESIARLAARIGDRALIGAGTVLDPADVTRVRQVGGGLIVSPNTHAPVIEATVAADMVSTPGFFTPSEAFDALRAGAHGLKLFPAEAISPAVVRAQRAVLPRDVPLLIVGGVRPETMRAYSDAGASGFGLGSGLYQAGFSPAEVGRRARAYVQGLAD
jgi:2-dehydro-3-deoxyphosphogalactonate aldolase